MAAQSGFHAVFARIDASGDASIALHRKCGFELVGIEREVGPQVQPLARRGPDAVPC